MTIEIRCTMDGFRKILVHNPDVNTVKARSQYHVLRPEVSRIEPDSILALCLCLLTF